MHCSQTSLDRVLRGCQPDSLDDVFLKVVGSRTPGIAILGNDLGRVARVVQLGAGAQLDAVGQMGKLDPPSARR